MMKLKPSDLERDTLIKRLQEARQQVLQIEPNAGALGVLGKRVGDFLKINYSLTDYVPLAWSLAHSLGYKGAEKIERRARLACSALRLTKKVVSDFTDIVAPFECPTFAENITLSYAQSGLWHPEHASILNFMLSNYEDFKILLEGPPGTGKSSIINTFINDLPLSVHVINSTNLHSDRAFDSEAILVIDDVDLLAPRSKREGEAQERAALHRLLFLLDNQPRVVLTTNAVDKLDPALIRPGRINRVFKVPDYTDRDNISELIIRQTACFLYNHFVEVRTKEAIDLARAAFKQGYLTWVTDLCPPEFISQPPAGKAMILNLIFRDVYGNACLDKTVDEVLTVPKKEAQFSSPLRRRLQDAVSKLKVLESGSRDLLETILKTTTIESLHHPQDRPVGDVSTKEEGF